jgi:hypothetical protein
VTAFKIPPDKTEADSTIRALIDEGFEKDKSRLRQRLPISMPRAEANMCSPEAESTHLWHPKKRPSDMEESTLSLKDLLEDSKLKDYIVNSFLPLAPNATPADAKDLKTKIRKCLGYPGYQDGSKNGIVVGWSRM